MLTFEQFIESHPEVAKMSKDEQLTQYDLYVGSVSESMDDWVLG